MRIILKAVGCLMVAVPFLALFGAMAHATYLDVCARGELMEFCVFLGMLGLFVVGYGLIKLTGDTKVSDDFPCDGDCGRYKSEGWNIGPCIHRVECHTVHED